MWGRGTEENMVYISGWQHIRRAQHHYQTVICKGFGSMSHMYTRVWTHNLV